MLPGLALTFECLRKQLVLVPATSVDKLVSTGEGNFLLLKHFGVEIETLCNCIADLQAVLSAERLETLVCCAHRSSPQLSRASDLGAEHCCLCDCLLLHATAAVHCCGRESVHRHDYYLDVPRCSAAFICKSSAVNCKPHAHGRHVIDRNVLAFCSETPLLQTARKCCRVTRSAAQR